MEEPYYLKLVSPAQKQNDLESPQLDPLTRFKKVVLNLIDNTLLCLNRIAQGEMEKESPSPSLMDEYFLLYHYIDFIKRLCEKR